MEVDDADGQTIRLPAWMLPMIEYDNGLGLERNVFETVVSFPAGLVNGTGFPWGQFLDPVPTPCQSHPATRGTGFAEYPWVGRFPAHPRVFPLSEGSTNPFIHHHPFFLFTILHSVAQQGC